MTDRSTIPLMRRAARVLPFDAEDRVLLLYSRDPARPTEPYWCTIGGAVEPGETPAEAAAREMVEETGLVVAPGDLTGPFHRAPVSSRSSSTSALPCSDSPMIRARRVAQLRSSVIA